MKIATAAIYTNYETGIVEAGDMAQEDMFIAGPVGEKLVLRFRNVGLSNLNWNGKGLVSAAWDMKTSILGEAEK